MDISLEEFAPFQSREDVLILDVRTPAEYEELRILHAINVPLDRLSLEELSPLLEGKNEIFSICRSGARSAIACSRLAEWGIKARNIIGGTIACAKEGLPLETIYTNYQK